MNFFTIYINKHFIASFFLFLYLKKFRISINSLKLQQKSIQSSLHKNNRYPSQGPENNSVPFYSSSPLSLEFLSPLFFPSPFLNPEIRSHMTMRTMPMARKLTAPTFRKKSEKYSIVSIFLFSQYHFHEPVVKSNLLQK